jgi:Mg/Co/Ni transporter MgtE
MSWHPIGLIVLAVLIVGAIVWGIGEIDGIDPRFKKIATVILIVALVIWSVVVLAGMLGVAMPR